MNTVTANMNAVASNLQNLTNAYTATLKITNNTEHDLKSTGCDWLINGNVAHNHEANDIPANSSDLGARFVKSGGVDGLFVLSGWKLGDAAFFTVYVAMSSAPGALPEIRVSAHEGQVEELDGKGGKLVTEYYKQSIGEKVNSQMNMVMSFLGLGSETGGAVKGPSCLVDGKEHEIKIEKGNMEYPDIDFRIVVG